MPGSRSRRPARLDRLDRHPGRRRRPAQPGPVPRRRAGRRRPERPALLAEQAARLGVEVVAVAAPDAEDLRSRSAPRRAAGTRRRPLRSRRRAAGRDRARGLPCDVVLNGIDRLDRAARRRWPRWTPGPTLALANKESLIVGGPLVSRAAAARADRAGRLRALGARAVPARRHGRRGAPAGAHRQRRPVPRPDARTSWPTSRPQQALAHPTWDDGPGRHDQLRDPGQQGPRGDRGAPALRRPATTASTSSCTRSRSSTRWSSSSTARRSRRLARRTCGCRSRSASAGPTGCRTPPPPSTGRRRSTWAFEPLDDEALPGGRAGPAGRRARAAPYPAVYNAANEECVAAFLAGRLGVPRHRRHGRARRRRRDAPARRTRRVDGRARRRRLGPRSGPGELRRRHRHGCRRRLRVTDRDRTSSACW